MTLDVTPLIETDRQLEQSAREMAVLYEENAGLVGQLNAIPGDELIAMFAEPGARVNVLNMRRDLVAAIRREGDLVAIHRTLIENLTKRTQWVVELTGCVNQQQQAIELLQLRIANLEGRGNV